MRTPVSTAPVAYAHGGDSEVLADHFKAAAQRWGAILTHGPGFVRLRRFPTDVLNHEQIERPIWDSGTCWASRSVKTATPPK